jgi:hypothetical protein
MPDDAQSSLGRIETSPSPMAYRDLGATIFANSEIFSHILRLLRLEPQIIFQKTPYIALSGHRSFALGVRYGAGDAKTEMILVYY